MGAILISDNGAGIPAAKLESIFEPFVQLGSRPANPSVGLGLGLSISRDLARGMGGDLKVHSEPGEGATFTLLLPLSSA
jgi:signal transduction histidine kinase